MKKKLLILGEKVERSKMKYTFCAQENTLNAHTLNTREGVNHGNMLLQIFKIYF